MNAQDSTVLPQTTETTLTNTVQSEDIVPQITSNNLEFSNSNDENKNENNSLKSKNARTAPVDTQTRKRTKASRACDQCRRKKIKCDYNDLTSICQYCERNHEKCSFERVQLKRGPSKGYTRSSKGVLNNKNNNLVGTQIENNPQVIGNSMESVTTEVATTDNTVEQPSIKKNSLPLPPLSQYIPQSNTLSNSDPNINNSVLNNAVNNPNIIEPASDTGLSSKIQQPDNLQNQPNSLNNTPLNVGQQQFWKVPYHEFLNTKRGSVDSLPSDLSTRNIAIQEQLLYSTTQPVVRSNVISTEFNNNSNRSGTLDQENTNGFENNQGSVGKERANSITGSNSSAYWSYFKNFNPPAPNEDQNIPFRRSSSIPSLLRQTSNSLAMGQQQLPHPSTSQLPPTYPYSQFYQQNPDSTQQPTTTAISSFGQYATTGFHSRSGSITSEVMSPSARLTPLERITTPSRLINSSTENQISRDIDDSKSAMETVHNNVQSAGSVTTITQSPQISSVDSRNNSGQIPEHALSNLNDQSQKRGNSVISINSIVDPTDTDLNLRNDDKNVPINKDPNNGNMNSVNSAGLLPAQQVSKQRSDQTGLSVGSNIASSSTVGTPAGNITTPPVVYGQISDVELIDIYYEFIHTGFPIIPLNKKTLTNDILLVNTQPISSLHELNNYVILWFRNSLELLVRLGLKRGKSWALFDFRDSASPFVKHGDNGSSTKGTPLGDHTSLNGDKRKSGHNDLVKSDFFEIQTIFISALNECFQKIVDIHPKFRENKDLISPKIKIIYLSTFIILNYILSYVGYDNSFVLGMSVTIFNEFKLYKRLLVDEIPEDFVNSDNSNLSEKDCDIIFKRLYILLIIFDSLQSCTFGGPKLLNIPINGTIDRFFDSNPDSEFSKAFDTTYVDKWCVETNPIKLLYIVQSLKLGEFLTELSICRKSVNGFDIDKQNTSNILWEPKSTCTIESGGFISVAKLFHNILLMKQKLTNSLISLEERDVNKPVEAEKTNMICESLTALVSRILQLLTLILRINSTNSIDPDIRPLNPLPNDQNQHSTSILSSGNDGTAPSTTNDFYQKLLGLNKNKSKDISENSNLGVISPFSIPIIYELHNVISIINRLPTHLIRIVLQTEGSDMVKPHEIVVKLSNSMNEVVQITNLFNMVKPFKIFDTDLNERSIGDLSKTDLIMRRKFCPDYKKNEDSDDVVENFIKSGWKLLDDSEFGWL